VSPVPTAMLLDGDISTKAYFTLEEFDVCILAFLLLTASSVVWRNLYYIG